MLRFVRGLCFYFFFFVLGLSSATFAATFPPHNLSPDLKARVDSVFSLWNRSDSPGCALAIVSKGQIIYERGYGMANLDHGIAIGPETVFYIGSVSKQFTAAAVALMAQERTLDLDADIRNYISEIPSYAQPISVRNLIHHTSGIRDIYTLMRLAGHRLEDGFTDREALDLIARQRELNFQRGSQFLYSNSGYFLLSETVKRLSRSSLREYAERTIFAPLEMRDTHFHDSPGHVLPRMATSYQPADNGAFRISYLSNFNKVGAGGLYSTLRDLFKWDQNFYHGRVGGQSFLEQIQTPGKLNDGTSLDYAFGLRVATYRELPTVGHGGSMMGFKAAYVRFPEQEFSVLCLCNLGSINPSRLALDVADIYLEPHFTEAPPAQPAAPSRSSSQTRPQISLSAAQTASLLGSYFSEELQTSLEVIRAQDGLRIRRADGSEEALTALSEERFRAGATTLRFVLDSNRSVKELRVDAGRAQNFLFERRPE